MASPIPTPMGTRNVPVSSSAVPSELMATPGNAVGDGRGVPLALEEYLLRCGELGKRPNAWFVSLASRVDFIVSLDFRGAQLLSDTGVSLIAAALPYLDHLRVLSVGDNGIGNDGLGAVCDALDKRPRQLQVLDLHGNPRVTRVGGQRLLNTAGRVTSLACCKLNGTRVSDYFETRIQRHVAAHYARMTDEERSEVDALVVSLSWGAGPNQIPGPRAASSVLPPHGPRHADGEFALRLKSSASVASPSQLFRNQSFDEAVNADADGDSALDSDDCVDAEEVAALRPLAPSALETVLYAGTPDFVEATTGGAYAITRHGRRRTVYNIATPSGVRFMSPGPHGSAAFPEAAEFAEIMASFKPREMELPIRFIFPGRIEYIPAVHAPDPMLAPPLPRAMTVREKRPDGTPTSAAVAASSVDRRHLAPAGGNSGSMFWSFFDSATGSSASGSASTPRQEQSQQMPGSSSTAAAADDDDGAATAEGPSAAGSAGQSSSGPSVLADLVTTPSSRRRDTAAEQERLFTLERASDTICASVSHNNLACTASTGRNRAVVPPRRPLCELVSDPAWVPSQPTRGRQVDHYNAQHKLKYDTVSGERFQVTGVFQREYVLQRVIRHNITERLTAGALNTRGTLLATSSYDMTCKLWSTETGKRLHTLEGHTGHISECGFNAPVCDKVITASYDKTVKVWCAETGSLLHTLRGHDLEIVALAVSKCGKRIVTGGMDDLAIVWGIDTGDELCTLAGHRAEVVTLDFSPDGSRVVSGSMDEAVRIWDTKDGTCEHHLTGHTQEIGHVSFNCFGNMVLSGSIDSTCRLWDAKTGACKVLRGHSREIVDCCFSPNGWQCASVSDDQTVRIWDVLTGGCITMITGHTAGVCHVSFNNTGTEILTGSLDMTARLWCVDTGECLQVLRGHRSVVLVSYSGDCERVMTISKDNSCRIWRREPEVNSLLHHAALAICQHPTVYQEVLERGVPEHLQAVLQRIHKRLYQTERDAVATPLPAMETPCSIDDEGVGGGGGPMPPQRSPTPAGQQQYMNASLNLSNNV